MPLDANDIIFLSDNVNHWVGRVGEIVVLESEQNYARVITSQGRYSIRCPLYKCEERLPEQFFRASRECIVNLSHVVQITMNDPKRFLLTLDNGETVLMSRIQSRIFRKTKSL